MIKIGLDDAQAQAAFRRLAEKSANLTPLMQQIGEHLAETTKQRFATSTAPDGSHWASNSETTFLNLLAARKGSYGKTGKLAAKGASRVAGKKPLIGETRSLSTTINYMAGRDFVEIGSPMEYAAVHQFGAKKHSFTGGKTPWGDIPARPFLGLNDQDTQAILGYVDDFLTDALGS